ncbi:hypothetical protein [Paenibacillus sp. R14(2021)]|uniref:hypothetical protein n=1 Tax=Paenibacillus sp. R14(2021) TaxID=2859228 RepID=UPI001C615068|nr:hypothetical protein [Paenibacillus sp. R14(2021)]
MKEILNVLLFSTLVSAATIIQVRRLIRKNERKTSMTYIAVMIVVVFMYAVVTLKAKLMFNPMSILQIPLENIGKYLFK